MNTSDDTVKQFLNPVKIMLELVDVNPENIKPWRKISFIFIILVSTILYVGAISFANAHMADLVQFCQVLATVSAHMQASLKLTSLFINKDKLGALLSTVKNDFWSTKITDEKTRKKLNQTANKLKLFMLIYFSLITNTCILFTFIPIITGKYELHLPIYYSFVDVQKNPMLAIMFVAEMILLVYNAIIITNGYDALFVALMTNLLTQIKLLKYVLQSLGKKEGNVSEVFRNERDLEVLKKCVKHHRLLIKFGNAMQELFAEMILLQYLTTLVVTCFAFVVVGILKSFSVLAFITFLSAHMVQLFIYCVFGSEYEYQSESISQAAYAGHWASYNNPHLRNGLRMIMLQAQRTKKFTAGYIIDLNLGNFINILRLSFSVRTLLASKAKDMYANKINEEKII